VFRLLFPVHYTLLSSLLIYSYPPTHTHPLTHLARCLAHGHDDGVMRPYHGQNGIVTLHFMVFQRHNGRYLEGRRSRYICDYIYMHDTSQHHNITTSRYCLSFCDMLKCFAFYFLSHTPHTHHSLLTAHLFISYLPPHPTPPQPARVHTHTHTHTHTRLLASAMPASLQLSTSGSSSALPRTAHTAR
jgi:hypothetical protein